ALGAGNLISGQSSVASIGIFVGPSTSSNCAAVLLDATGITIQGNRIGTNAAGSAKVPNRIGIYVGSPGVHIGGTNAGEGNQISGNNGANITLASSCNNLRMGSNALIEGNNIGLDTTGNAKLPTPGTGAGIQVNAPGATIRNNVIAGNGVAAGV